MPRITGPRNAGEFTPDDSAMTPVDPRRLVFIGGLHRSGTTLLGRVLADHPEVSGFSGTGAPEDEGQHLQGVYRPARAHGGPGRFARSPDAHLTEIPGEVAVWHRAQLLADWVPYWDLSRTFLVEKSPPNLIMGRYLQSIFPGSALIVILRHPVVVALSTKKWTPRTSVVRLVEHWFFAHQVLARDAQHLHRLHVVRYEDLIARPREVLEGLQHFLALSTVLGVDRVESTRSAGYLDTWSAMTTGPILQRRRRREIERRFTTPAATFGYRIDDPTVLDPWPGALGGAA